MRGVDRTRACVGQRDATLIQNRYLAIRDWVFTFHVLINHYCPKKVKNDQSHFISSSVFNYLLSKS